MALESTVSTGTVSDWAVEHPVEWEIVSGIRCTSMEKNIKIMNMLAKDGLVELAELMSLCIYQYMCDSAKYTLANCTIRENPLRVDRRYPPVIK